MCPVDMRHKKERCVEFTRDNHSRPHHATIRKAVRVIGQRGQTRINKAACGTETHLADLALAGLDIHDQRLAEELEADFRFNTASALCQTSRVGDTLAVGCDRHGLAFGARQRSGRHGWRKVQAAFQSNVGPRPISPAHGHIVPRAELCGQTKFEASVLALAHQMITARLVAAYACDGRHGVARHDGQRRVGKGEGRGANICARIARREDLHTAPRTRGESERFEAFGEDRQTVEVDHPILGVVSIGDVDRHERGAVCGTCDLLWDQSPVTEEPLLEVYAGQRYRKARSGAVSEA